MLVVMHLLHVEVFTRLEIHDVHIEVIGGRHWKELAQDENFPLHGQYRLLGSRSMQELRLLVLRRVRLPYNASHYTGTNRKAISTQSHELGISIGGAQSL